MLLGSGKNVQYSNDSLRIELLQICKKHRPSKQKYVIDEMINAHASLASTYLPMPIQYLGKMDIATKKEVMKTWNDALQILATIVFAIWTKFTLM